MGMVSFYVNIKQLLAISNQQTHFRQLASASQVYPDYYCTRAVGICPVRPPDPPSLRYFFIDMVWRLYGTVEEGYNYTATIQKVIEWFGGLISLCCSIAALSYWTNFSISRKFCLLGWLCMMVTPAISALLASNHHVKWDRAEETIVTAGAEIWEDLDLFIRERSCPTATDPDKMCDPCQQIDEHLKWLTENVQWLCSWKGAIGFFLDSSVTHACDRYREFYTLDREDKLKDASDSCRNSISVFKDSANSRTDFEQLIKNDYIPGLSTTLWIMVGVRAGLSNFMRIIPAVVSMVPALMQGGLMVKNLVPRQTMPNILTTLPWAYTIVVWMTWQMYYQVMDHWMMLLACLLLSFGPMVYYVSGKFYDLQAPMDDQQSITITFRIWYYALILSLITPYATLIIYITWFNTTLEDWIFEKTIGWLLKPSLDAVLGFISGTLLGYAYTLQAGIDWFVDELMLHHLAAHAPIMIASSPNPEKAKEWVKQLNTQLDVDSIEQGAYVCGGLSDPNIMYPPQLGEWRHKAQTYAISLARKDFETLDAFTAHIRQDKELPEIMERGRRCWYKWMDYPDKWKGEGMDQGQAILGRKPEGEDGEDGQPPTNAGPDQGAGTSPSGASSPDTPGSFRSNQTQRGPHDQTSYSPHNPLASPSYNAAGQSDQRAYNPSNPLAAPLGPGMPQAWSFPGHGAGPAQGAQQHVPLGSAPTSFNSGPGGQYDYGNGGVAPLPFGETPQSQNGNEQSPYPNHWGAPPVGDPNNAQFGF